MADDLQLRVVTALLEMRDAPHPMQTFWTIHKQIGVESKDEVYRALAALEAEGITRVSRWRPAGSGSLATGWDVTGVELAEAFLHAGGRLFRFPIATPGPRSRPSALAERILALA